MVRATASEAGRMQLVNALSAHRGRAWVRLICGQGLACAGLLACGPVAISVAVCGYGSMWQRVSVWQSGSVSAAK
jgi:hypothetical protein